MSDFIIQPHPVANDVLLIDLSGIFHACWHISKNKTVSYAHDDTVEAVRKMRADRRYVVVCCDSPKSNRKDIYPGYKANRDAKDATLIAELRRTCETLTKDGMNVWRCDGFEADDVIATTAVEALKRGHTVTVASGDKDLMALVGPGIQQMTSKDLYDEQAVKLKFGVPPKLIPDLLALWGDTSDNIPGVEGVGPGTAAALLNAFGSLAAVVEQARLHPEKVADVVMPKGTKVGPKRAEALAKHNEYEIASELIELRTDAPIPPFEQIYEERAPAPLAEPIDETEMREPDAEPEQETEPVNETPDIKPIAPQATPQNSVRMSSGEMVVLKDAARERALAPTRPPFEHGLEPQSLETALKLAVRLHESRLYAKKFQSVDAILAIVIRGRELGWGALASMDAFHSYEGRPMLQAHAIISLVKAHPDCEYFTCIETTPESCTYETKHRRNPHPTTLTYTLAQALNAGLIRPGSNWEKRPDEMVRKTCAVQLARMEYPDAAMGIYSMEECGAEADAA